MWFLLEEGRFHNVFDDKQAKWPIAEKNHQNIHPQLIHMTLQDGLAIKVIGFRVESLYNKFIYKVRKTTLEPWVWS